jgi:hypothetical protein
MSADDLLKVVAVIGGAFGVNGAYIDPGLAVKIDKRSYAIICYDVG